MAVTGAILGLCGLVGDLVLAVAHRRLRRELLELRRRLEAPAGDCNGLRDAI